MKEIFQNAGLKNITEKEVPSRLKSGTVQRYWDMITEIGAPIVAALSKADEAMRQKIKKEVFELVAGKYPGNNVAIDASAIVIAAEKRD